MSEHTGSEDMHSLLGAYALDAVDADERAAFEAHLVGCEDCRSQLPGLLAAAARLGATAYVTPPAHLRATLLALVTRTRQLPPATGAAGSRGLPQQRLASRLLGLAAALLLVVAGGLGIAVGVEHSRAGDARRQLADLIQHPARTQTVSVPGGGSFVVNTAGNRAFVQLVGVAAPPVGKTYEMWLVPASGKLPRKAALIPTGHGIAYVSDTGNAAALALTLEPAGGSSQPTTEPFVTAKV